MLNNKSGTVSYLSFTSQNYIKITIFQEQLNQTQALAKNKAVAIKIPQICLKNESTKVKSQGHWGTRLKKQRMAVDGLHHRRILGANLSWPENWLAVNIYMSFMKLFLHPINDYDSVLEPPVFTIVDFFD